MNPLLLEEKKNDNIYASQSQTRRNCIDETARRN